MNARTLRQAHLTFDGITQPIAEWALDYGIPADLIRDRLRKGWTVERAITAPMRVHKGQKLEAPKAPKAPARRGTYTYKGRTQSLAHWAEQYRLDPGTARCRLRKGIPLDHPIGDHARRFTHDGKTLTAKQWAQHLGLSPFTVMHRLRRGLPLDQALAPRHRQPAKPRNKPTKGDSKAP